MNLIVQIDSNALTWFKGYWYRSAKLLLGIAQQVNKDRLLKVCLGKSFEDYQKIES